MPAKHQQVNRPIVLEIISQWPTCRYLHICGSSVGTLSIFPNKSYISRTYFASLLSACLSHAGYDPGLYKCYSFHIGAATTGATKGFTRANSNYGHMEICSFLALHSNSYDAATNMFINSHSAGAAAGLVYKHLYCLYIILCSGLACSAWYGSQAGLEVSLVWESGWSGSRASPPTSNIVDSVSIPCTVVCWEIFACIG